MQALVSSPNWNAFWCARPHSLLGYRPRAPEPIMVATGAPAGDGS